MASKTIFFLCAQVLLIQTISATLAGNGCCGCGCGCGTNTGGRTLEVVSSSAPPTGLQVISENAYEGCLGVGGKLPFLGSAGVQGCATNEGCSKICYGCGCGNIGISNEAGCAGAAGLRGCCGGCGGCCCGGRGGY